MTDTEKQQQQQKGYWWDRGLTSPQVGPPPKLEAEVVPVVNNGASAWNAAGTWEEKSAKSTAHRFISSHLSSLQIGPHSVSSPSVSGDASVVIVRGRKKPGFAISLSFSLSTTSVSVSEVADDDIEDFTVSFENDDENIAKFEQQIRESIIKMFSLLKEELQK
eukprot:comp16583_c0_seq1/m.26713 comp16583_c0_seq1/g.26713  ORF comp16583_c0_seq1/g.26713 comp16583_c0_seq1/m.26713 type:complete len:163 (+) comp16583_c0_seq1:26-514(+)